ncbi:MAG: hypothetical protein F6K37_30770 [Moorea sp. SIO4E2]|uniref:hypothetical protein n=1 Tax=Moorena sp. SIO4E2 TaxID=2607826 RepID=UPI0013BD952B|nr:hypothetical protein [Moorena sp. SIO4E2]NEQ10160.1 hypothetical protein [Moorena sp. SIO4E2]
MGNGEWGMGNGEWGMGNLEGRMKNGEWGIGNGELGMGASHICKKVASGASGGASFSAS